MLYIFDLGNVIVDIDFNRVLGAWSDFSRVPLATLKQNFAMGETFHQHERGEISDEEFAEHFCQDMGLSLSYEQFSHGWQAVFVAIRPEVIDIMHKLREQGHRVVVLSNTNRLHTTFWPEEYPEVKAAADKIYLSQEMGMRKPEARIYQAVLQAEGFTAADAVFFDDNADNIEGANQLGITSILVKLLWHRIDEDNMTTLAGNLAYVSLLSLVPLVAVIFALFSAFPMFADVSLQLRHFVFANFIPATGDVIQNYIEQFVANSNKMTAVGACGLIVTALLLMYAIDSALNTIWRSKKARPKVYSFAVYWMILTLGPLLAGASLAISSYLLSLRWASDLNGVIDNVLRIFPLILSWLSFWLLYSVVPTTRVPNRDAVVGALVAAVLFELGKKGFALYITMFPSYQLIYGVLAVIPILFVWVYWTWCIVLLGAEITVTLGVYRELKKAAAAEKQQEADQP